MLQYALTFIQEQVYTDAVKTDSGIYLTSQDKKKETLKIKILHVPKNRKLKEVNVGDIVCTDDDHQYYLNYDGRDYIKLHHNEIAAKFVEA
jgi:co-chaperonin GroES (HSP10)